MAYLYERIITIDLGPQDKDSFYDEEILSDSYPSLNMDHLQNSISIHQFAVSDNLCDPSEDLRYRQTILEASGKERVVVDTWNQDEWYNDDKLNEFYGNLPEFIVQIIKETLLGSETYDFTGEVDTYASDYDLRCELIQSEGAHQIAFDEDELETYDLSRFYGIWINHRHGEIDDSFLLDIPEDPVDPNMTDEEKEDLEYIAGVDFTSVVDGDEICQDYDDEYEVFGYVTAATDSGEDEDEE